MNLQAVVAPAAAVVNPAFSGSVLVSAGYTTDAAGKRTPVTNTVSGVLMQVQALSAGEIEHLDSLNIQGVRRAVYMNGNIEGIDRPAGKGGDILLIPTGLSVAPPGTDRWLVVGVIESWDSGGWTKVAVQLQLPS